MKIIKENSNTRVKKALFGDVTGKISTFALLTAENPLGKELSAKENNKRTARLKEYCKKLGIQYIPIEGSFGNIEHSFMLINLAQKDAEFLAKKFNQLSFFFGKTTNVVNSEDRNTASVISYYQTDDNCKSYSLIEKSDKIDNKKDAEDFFSRHGDFKFSINMDVFNEDLKPLTDLRSIDDSLTIKGRAIFRGMRY